MSLAQDIENWARARLGQQVGRGECWDLVNQALIAAGAHGSDHYGVSGDNADYVWGQAVALSAIQPGDVLQMRDHVVTRTVVTRTRYSDGEEGADTEDFIISRDHHTLIVTRLLDQNGTITSLEQNVDPGGRVVQALTVNTRSVPTTTTTRAGRAIDPRNHREGPVTIITETTISVSGTIWAYRPQAR